MTVMTMSAKPAAALPFTDDDARWEAVLRRDRAADGAFYFSVRTTGVYCRPACPARLPRRENVRFHASPEEAERAGFRPCKRCKSNLRNPVGTAEAVRFAIGECWLGSILVAASGKGVCAILLGDDPAALMRDLRTRFAHARFASTDKELATSLAHVVRWIETPGQTFDLPLDLRGTPFQRRVWAALRDVPPGSTASYAEISVRIGEPQAARAVAQACAANAIAVAIPCHRIRRADGSLSGYRWGATRKRTLLDREASA